jgi:superfamily II DNA or RNA helicase/HKD family nuclease
VTGVCPLCAPAFADVLVLDDLTILLRGGEALALAPRRHVARWRDLDPAERAALAERIGPAQARAEVGAQPAGVWLDETADHVCLRIGAAPATAAADDHGDAPHGRSLIAGADDALLAHLAPHIDRASAVDAAVAFVLRSGAALLMPHLQDLLDRGGRLRLLTGDYLDATDPDALRMLRDLGGERDLRVFETRGRSFHPKSWIFRFTDGAGALLVGSSNLSRPALTDGVEWNLRLFGGADAAPLVEARTAFDALFAGPDTKPLTDAWIDAYAERRTRPDRPVPVEVGVVDEAPEPPPEPHGVQVEALGALAASRARGHRAGLVVLATGLGKTFLAAFDSRLFARVLFIAHRDEILAQAMAAFRRVRPEARLGRFAADRKDRDADVLFASIQTLARPEHLDGFAPDAFDYIVVDEFHHAAARSYRAVIDRFEPAFLLGLTATPERADGGDLLGLCGENLVYRCDLWAGVERGLLSPFVYWGVPDPVDYAQIPWRGRSFDEAALTQALATQARAENALDQLRRRGGTRAIGFCASQAHADFMARFSAEQGLRAVAVHSGLTSAPRTSSLQRLAEGELDIVYAVDMFNEGVDVPAIDTVLMLRPTESPVIWLQQFGRGLRRAEGKRLAVIDYIGAHRSFLTKARALLQVGEGQRALAEKLDSLRRGEVILPPGCEITYELETLDILDRLLRRTRDGDELEAFYRDFLERHGERPTALEAHHAGFDPRRTGHDGWFGFVADMGGLTPTERAAATAHRALLREVETTAMTRAYKMLVLRAMIDAGTFPGAIDLDRLVAGVARQTRRDPRLAGGADEATTLDRALARYALPALSDMGEGRWFAAEDAGLRTLFAPVSEEAAALASLVSELVDWRLGQFLDRGADRIFETPSSQMTEAAEGPSPFQHAELWREYKREEIAPLFGDAFNPGSWNAGIVTIDRARAMILLVTLEKGGLAAGNHYEDRFEDAETFRWATQTSTRRDGRRGRIISGAEPGWTIHLFVRSTKLRNGLGAPFRYCGPVRFLDWEGDAPISVRWRLAQGVPEHLRKVMGV